MPDGRYRWYPTVERIGSIDVHAPACEWVEDEAPKCTKCSDYGEWIDEDGDSSACPECGGEIVTEGPTRRIVEEDD